MKVSFQQSTLLFLLCLISLPALFLVESFNVETNKEVDEETCVQKSHFPSGFLFGAGTSNYQIEGATSEDGRGISNWDAFCSIKGTIANGENADVADDHYHRYLEDIELIQSLGIKSYRFSISWSRILPRGRFGGVNPAGILFYNRIIDNLLGKGITPFVTILHHEIPQELEDRYGSWLSPLMQEDFVLFAETCFSNFGNRVKYWVTINEPNVFTWSAYEDGSYPPGRCSPPFGNCYSGNSDIEPLTVVHNMLLAHAKAVKLYREKFQSQQGGMIGISANVMMFRPLTDHPVDKIAANRAMAFDSGWVFDPVVFGDYPPEMRFYHGNELPSFTSEEKLLMTNSTDFIGINHYCTLYAKDCLYSKCSCNNETSCMAHGDRVSKGYVLRTGKKDGVTIGQPTALSLAFVVPSGMEEVVNYLATKYHKVPIFVTENDEEFNIEKDWTRTLMKLQVESSVVNITFGLAIHCTQSCTTHDSLSKYASTVTEYLLDNLVLDPNKNIERGYALPDENPSLNDLVNDVRRIEYHKAYLSYLARAIRNGADVRGYFLWSLMDNFEWVDGYRMRFGLYYVDRQTLERTPKLSAKWYRDFLSNTSLKSLVQKSSISAE